MTVKVFVYGTLKPGEIHYRLCAEQVTEAQPAIALGRLYHLPFGYPAMSLDRTGIVHGFVLSFPSPTILATLDEFEQHDPQEFERYTPHQSLKLNQYRRAEVKTFSPDRAALANAWCYVMVAEQIDRLEGICLPQGCWSSRQKNWR